MQDHCFTITWARCKFGTFLSKIRRSKYRPTNKIPFIFYKVGGFPVQIAAATGLGTRQLAQQAHQLLSELDRSVRERKLENPAILHPEPRRARFEVTSDEDGRMIVTGSTPEWLAETLDLTESEPRAEFFDRLKRLGVSRALNRLGIDKGDPVRIGDVTIRWESM